jgi:glutamate synthase domain-containing protein 1/glutamate synthase domain-containing protein 3
MIDLTEALLASAADLPRPGPSYRKAEAEGGCGVLGLAAARRVPGRVLLQALGRMRNRGNGKGGGIAAAGLDPAFFGVRTEVLRADYLLAIAYPDPSARAAVEAAYVEPVFAVDHVTTLGTTVTPQRPQVCCYVARVRPDVRDEFSRRHGIPDAAADAAEDEVVFQNSYRLNHAFYAATGEKRAFVLSHGRDLLVLKVVGYGDDVIGHYGIGDLAAHVWIGHHRYPTKGRVWHPGGAHPFVGMHEALVHNGDFANYAALCTYLRQRNRYPLFLTDTEVAALLFDLLHRVYDYPLEYVIEALAPTTERDFALLPAERQRVYRTLQTVHMTGSPDGPWYFLLAQSGRDAVRLVGVTDTSMLRPQVFALQHGEVGIGLAASEKQAIDAVLESLAGEDPRFWRRADAYWHARGGSHTDGGAFVFTVAGDRLSCTDKFGRLIGGPSGGGRSPCSVSASTAPVELAGRPPETVFTEVTTRLPGWDEQQLRDFLGAVRRDAADDEARAFALLALLMDRRYPTGALRRSLVLAHIDECMEAIVDDLRRAPSRRYVYVGGGPPWPPVGAGVFAVLDARKLPSEGPQSLSRAIVELYRCGARRFLVVGVRGQRFIGCGLGPRSHGVRIDVFGSPGDYLGSGLDGAEVVVHGSAQDQVGQILTDGRLVVHGDVGQAFLYAAKGGDVFVLGDTAGRTLINAVGRPRVVINGTCLDYLAESFMAGDPSAGGGFAVVNGITVDSDGRLSDRETPYSGGNLFSLAAAGALYIRDPRGMLTDDQLNGAEFTSLNAADWELIRPYLDENERLLAVPVDRLLTVDGTRCPPHRVYRKVCPVRHHALSPEEAWVKPTA